MGLFERISGIMGSFFQLGGPSGPALKNNAGSIDARNSGDSAYINVRGLDPAIADDLVTKRYGDANYGGGGSGHTGAAVLDFGASPGSDRATLVVVGQTGILSSSRCLAWLDAIAAATADHTQDEHSMAAAGGVGLTCQALVAGTGFTIVASSERYGPMIGKFNVLWMWE